MRAIYIQAYLYIYMCLGSGSLKTEAEVEIIACGSLRKCPSGKNCEGRISGKGKELRKTVVSGKVQLFPINRGGVPDNPFLTMNQAVISTDEMMRLPIKVNPIDHRQSP